MENEFDIIANMAESLGPELYAACKQNDVAQVQALTTNLDASKWSNAVLTAASEKSIDVVRYGMENTPSPLRTTNEILFLVLYHPALEPAYRFLVESKLVKTEHYHDTYGHLLGAAALACRVLAEVCNGEQGSSTDQRPFMHGSVTVLAAAAGNSDEQMVGLLLDHGATMRGSGALIYAAKRGNQNNVRYLLSRGADVNEVVPLSELAEERAEGGSALHWAVENGHVAVVDVLLEGGADTELKDAKGRTAKDIAVAKRMDEAVLTRLS